MPIRYATNNVSYTPPPLPHALVCFTCRALKSFTLRQNSYIWKMVLDILTVRLKTNSIFYKTTSVSIKADGNVYSNIFNVCI